MILIINDKIFDYEDDEKDFLWSKEKLVAPSNGSTYIAPDEDDKFRLSKSRFCSGCQCLKMVWLKKYHSELFDSSTINEAVVSTGNEVGDLAMGLFGDYTEVPYDKENLSSMLDVTSDLLKQGVSNICEASFSYKGLFCSVDILRNKGDNHIEIYEVKCSTSVHEQYIPDVAFQNYVLKKLGFIVDRVCLVHINNQYVRHGDLDIHEFFMIEDLTEQAESLFNTVDAKVDYLRTTLISTEEPDIEISECCKSPYQCGFWQYCARDIPQPNVFDLCGTFIKPKKKWDLFRSGCASFEAVLGSDIKVSDNSVIEIEHAIRDIPPRIEKNDIAQFLDSFSYPLYFLDFESFFPAIPRYDNSKPYGQICFQYSLHYIETEGGELKHKEYLAYPGRDPRRELCESLVKDIPMNVCTLAYNKTFEVTRIKEMAEIFPDLSDHLLNIAENMKDLMVPFLKRYYYCRAMQGSYSIKYVLPALFPNDPSLDYHNLEGVHNGGEAANTFLLMEEMSPDELERYRGYLLKYCGLDTYAMVKIWEKLKEVTD